MNQAIDKAHKGCTGATPVMIFMAGGFPFSAFRSQVEQDTMILKGATFPLSIRIKLYHPLQ
jgi:hypothetical protein